MHRRTETGRRSASPKSRREKPLGAALVDRPGGRRHRTAEDGKRPPRDETHRRLGARKVRLHLHRLLAVAGLHHGQHPHGRRHGADPRAVRIPRPGRAFQTAQHHPQGQGRTEPRPRHRGLPADDVHAQPPEQPGGERGPRALRPPGLRHNNPAQYPFGRSALARKTRDALRRRGRRLGKLPGPGPGISETQPQTQQINEYRYETEGIRTRTRRHFRQRSRGCQAQTDESDGRNRNRRHHTQPHAAAHAVRRGGSGRTGRLDPPAGRHPARDGEKGRRRQIRHHQRRTPLAGRAAGRPEDPPGLYPRGGRREPARHGPRGEHPAPGSQCHRDRARNAAPDRRVQPDAGRPLGKGGQETLDHLELHAAAQAARRGAAGAQGGAHLDGARQSHRRRPRRDAGTRAQTHHQERPFGTPGRGAGTLAHRTTGRSGTECGGRGVSRKLFAAGGATRKVLLAGHQHQALEKRRRTHRHRVRRRQGYRTVHRTVFGTH